jgi:hypothetical protein
MYYAHKTDLSYDSELLAQAMLKQGLSYYALARRALVDPKTVKSIVKTGKGQADKIYHVARALGFPVKRDDFSSIMLKPAADGNHNGDAKPKRRRA